MANPPDPVPADQPPSSETPSSVDALVLLKPGLCPVPDYELVRRLGCGGYGEVWKANGPGGFAVALKFIRLGEPISKPELRAISLMKDIRHPHLLGMFGCWRRGNYLVVAMELADRTLMDRWKEAVRDGHSGIPAAELVEYVREAAKGIDHLNGLGVQHRDIKPHNLLLVGGSVKVADFGLAKLLEGSCASNSGAMTPNYAAPEFFHRHTSSHSDQYSLAVGYCLLRGGRLPFEGSSAQVMTGHLMHPPDLTMLPEAERPVVARALAKKPAERWPNCRAFAEALVATGAAQATTPTAQTPSPAALAPTVPSAQATRPAATSRGASIPWKAIGVGLAALAALAAVVYRLMS
jgi:serine/threonine protein kinase